MKHPKCPISGCTGKVDRYRIDFYGGKDKQWTEPCIECLRLKRMALCKLMVFDFMYGTGRIEPAMPKEPLRYTDENLREGIAYCKWFIKEFGYKREPFYDFNLENFIEWAKNMLQSEVIS